MINRDIQEAILHLAQARESYYASVDSARPAFRALPICKFDKLDVHYDAILSDLADLARADIFERYRAR